MPFTPDHWAVYGLFALTATATVVEGIGRADGGGIYERLGVAGILVLAAYFLMRYFMSELAKKDERLIQVTDRFIASTEKVTAVIEESTAANNKVDETLTDLKRVIDQKLERRG